MKLVILSILAAIVANAMALLLVALLATINYLIFNPNPSVGNSLQLILIVCFLGSAFMAKYVFPISLGLALIGLLVRWRSRWIYILGGGLASIAVIIFYYSRFLRSFDPQSGFLIIIGSACGWIYWRIAIGRTPGNGHAIDGP